MIQLLDKYSQNKQAIAIYMERGMSKKAQETQNSLNLCYAYAGRPMETNEAVENASRKARNEELDAIIKDETDKLELYKTYLGKLQYADALGTIAGCYQTKEEYGKSIEYYKQYIEALRDAIRDEFRMQSEAERMPIWADEKTIIQDIMEMFISLPDDQESLMPDLSSLAYDCMLLSKGILLNSSVEFEKVIAASNDAELKAKYEETKRINAELQKLRQTASSDEEFEQVIKLQQQSQKLQLDISSSCAEIKDFTNYISYSWKDVQRKLQKDDEFFSSCAVDSRLHAML